MSLCQIRIESLQAVVDLLRRAAGEAVSDADTLRRNLDDVWLSCSRLGQWGWNGAAVAELNDIRADLERRLAQARQIAGMSPQMRLPQIALFPPVTVGTDGYGRTYHDVAFDDGEMSDEDARRAADLVSQITQGKLHLDGTIPADLAGILIVECADPEFCQTLAKLIPPDKLASFLSILDIEQSRLIDGSDPVALAHFQTRYAAVLDAFGVICSTAATTMTGQDGDDYLQRWHDVFADSSPHGSTAPLVSMVAARGMWPPEYLTAMATGIESAEKDMGAGSWQPWQPGGPNGAIRRIVDPGKRYQDGAPVTIADPMQGVWSAAAYTPQWFIDTYQGHDLVDVVLDRAGYDGSGFNPAIPDHEMVDSSIRDLFDGRGFDQASLWAFLQAASLADMRQDLDGQTGSCLHDATAMIGAADRDRREWNELPWWDKHNHEILETASFALGTAAMLIPGIGWAAAGLLMAGSLAAGAYDVCLYAADGDMEDAVITGIFLLPMMIGGAIRLVQISRDAWQALKTGETIDLLGQDVRLDDGAVVYAETGSKTPPASMHVPDSSPFDPDYGTPLPTHGTAGDPFADGSARTGLPYQVKEPYGHTPDGTTLSLDGYNERFVEPDGSPHFPANNGAVPGTIVRYNDPAAVIRDHGAAVDRIGYEGGNFLSFQVGGVPATFDERALSLDSLAKPYFEYELTGNLPDGWSIETSTTAYGYGRDGGAIQLMVFDKTGTVVSVRKLLDVGVLSSR